ncbi:hypothetical protein [Phaffia rhodozyma]|uniref:Uncharacterized protein n=1 Tax=Phaffia rhodozyma TaxID=264483 RepID=A0A0F7SKJ8_PHARH|nr:hypothetical protein [Phaffia rhodozyma]
MHTTFALGRVSGKHFVNSAKFRKIYSKTAQDSKQDGLEKTIGGSRNSSCREKKLG